MKSKRRAVERIILFTVAASWYAIAQETNKHIPEIFFAKNTLCKRNCSKDPIMEHYGKSPPPPSSDLRPSPNARRHLEFLKKRARIDPPALLTGDRAPSLRWSCSPPSPRSMQRPAPKNTRAFSVLYFVWRWRGMRSANCENFIFQLVYSSTNICWYSKYFYLQNGKKFVLLYHSSQKYTYVDVYFYSPTYPTE